MVFSEKIFGGLTLFNVFTRFHPKNTSFCSRDDLKDLGFQFWSGCPYTLQSVKSYVAMCITTYGFYRIWIVLQTVQLLKIYEHIKLNHVICKLTSLFDMYTFTFIVYSQPYKLQHNRPIIC